MKKKTGFKAHKQVLLLETLRLRLSKEFLVMITFSKAISWLKKKRTVSPLLQKSNRNSQVVTFLILTTTSLKNRR